MTTFTLNRNFDAVDCLFVAMNDNIYADWKESQMRDTCHEESRTAEQGLGKRILSFFRR